MDKYLSKLKGITTPKVEKIVHSFYIYAIQIDEKITKVKKDIIFKALKAEGLDNLIDKYFNLHLLPMYQKKYAYGTKGFPGIQAFRKEMPIIKSIGPVAEGINKDKLIIIELCVYDFNDSELKILVRCLKSMGKSK